MLTFIVLFAFAARADAPVPPWSENDAALRLVFPASAAPAFALCSLPAAAGGQPLSAVRAVANGAARPLRVVAASSNEIQVLADCRGLGGDTMVAVYGITGATPLLPGADGAVDPVPIRIAARRSVGQDSPATLAEMKMLTLRPGRAAEFFHAATFADVPGAIGNFARGGGWEQPLVLLRLSTWLLVPQTAAYAFALKGDNAAWLQIDGQEVVAQGYSRGRPGQRESRALTISAGLHRMLVDTAVRYSYDLTVLWHAIDSNAAEPQLITGTAAVEGRLEQRELAIHPFIRAQRGAPYRFQSTAATFSMLALQDGSVNWGGGQLRHNWSLNGAAIGDTPRLQTLLVTTGDAPFEVALEVSHGATGTSARTAITLPPDPVPAAEFRISTAISGVPAICYGEDPIAPAIEVRASAPDALAYTVAVDIIGATGPVSRTSAPLQLHNSWGQVALPPGKAADLREICWQVIHGGVVISRGRRIFEAAPFATLPDGVSGVSLLRGNDSLTLVARRASQGEANAFKGLQPGQRLIFLDGFVAPAANADSAAAIALDAAIANSPRGMKIAYQRIAIQALDRDDDPRGVSRLAPLAGLRQLLPVNVILMAPDLSGARDGEALEMFERRLAAFVGALTEAGKAQVILVAPPAFDVLPGCGCEPTATPCPHAAVGRLYAETVYRVADAYGLTVADLYTPFALNRGPEPLFRAGVLTPAGLEKAAAIFRQILYR